MCKFDDIEMACCHSALMYLYIDRIATRNMHEKCHEMRFEAATMSDYCVNARCALHATQYSWIHAIQINDDNPLDDWCTPSNERQLQSGWTKRLRLKTFERRTLATRHILIFVMPCAMGVLGTQGTGAHNGWRRRLSRCVRHQLHVYFMLAKANNERNIQHSKWSWHCLLVLFAAV